MEMKCPDTDKDLQTEVKTAGPAMETENERTILGHRDKMRMEFRAKKNGWQKGREGEKHYSSFLFYFSETEGGSTKNKQKQTQKNRERKQRK